MLEKTASQNPQNSFTVSDRKYSDSDGKQ